MKRSLKKRLRIPEPTRLDDLFDADPLFSTDHVAATFSNLVPEPLNYEQILTNTREAMASIRDSRPRAHVDIVPPWLVTPGYMTRENIIAMVTERLRAHGYLRVHVVAGEVAPGHVRAHALAFIPPRVLHVIREEIEDLISMAIVVDVSATDCGHEDCHAYQELGRACYESTHPALL